MPLELLPIISNLQILCVIVAVQFCFCCRTVYVIVSRYREATFSVLDDIETAELPAPADAFCIEEDDSEPEALDKDAKPEDTKNDDPLKTHDKHEKVVRVLQQPVTSVSTEKTIDILLRYVMRLWLTTFGVMYAYFACDSQERTFSVALDFGLLVGTILHMWRTPGSCHSFSVILLCCAEGLILFDAFSHDQPSMYHIFILLPIFMSATICTTDASPRLARDVIVSSVGLCIVSLYIGVDSLLVFISQNTLETLGFNTATYVITFGVLPFFKALNMLVLVYVVQNKTTYYYLVAACGFDISLSVHGVLSPIDIVNIVLLSIVLLFVAYSLVVRRREASASTQKTGT